MSDFSKPVQISTGRDSAVGNLSSMISNALVNGGNIGDWIQSMGKLSGYNGQLTAPTTPGQNAALSVANQAFMRMFGLSGGTGSATTPVAPPPQIDLSSFFKTGANPQPTSPIGTPPAINPVPLPVGGNDPLASIFAPSTTLNTGGGAGGSSSTTPAGGRYPNGAIAQIGGPGGRYVYDDPQLANADPLGFYHNPANGPFTGVPVFNGTNPTPTLAPGVPPTASAGPGGITIQDLINQFSGNTSTSSSAATSPAIAGSSGGGGGIMELLHQFLTGQPMSPGTPPSTTPGPVSNIGTFPGMGADTNINRIASQTGLNLPPQLQQVLNGILGNQSGMASQIQGAAGVANPYIDTLAKLGLTNPNSGVVQSLQSLAAGPGGAAPGSSILSGLMGDPRVQQLLSGGQSTDLATITKAITDAAQPGVDRGVRDLREQFSTLGLRDGTDINAAAQDYLTNSTKNVTGQVASLLPQIMQGANTTSLGALSSLGDIGSRLATLGQGDISSKIAALVGAGNLNLGQSNVAASATQGAAQAATGQQGTVLDALTKLMGTTSGTGNNILSTLSGLFGSQQQNSTTAALAQPGTAATLAQLPGQVAAQNYSLNTADQQQQQTALTNAYQEWLRQQQGITPTLLSFLGATPAPTYGASPLSSLTNLLGTGLAGYSAVKGAK